MNLALPALVVFVVLLPGFIARSRARRVERSSLDYSPFGQTVAEAVLWTLVLHFLWVHVTYCLTSQEASLGIVLALLSSDASIQTKALDTVANQAGPVILYFTTLLVFSWLAPLALRELVTWGRLDRATSKLSSLLRFSAAPWYYLLSGADFKRAEQPDLISISAIVDLSGAPWLYTGVLDEYFLDQEGELDRLVLREVMRRPLSRDKCPEDVENVARFYRVDGDCFVLRYREAITLNVRYIKLTDESET
ncbi:hypothetical protein [Polycyclovorans algicola]|uniref:hypothetical protein n=1 Tax=Polycyclovorans algicola TaxID=616992 RepID=UPI0004A73090|nr:hypothetical protein [Polycyclovorans algicola]